MSNPKKDVRDFRNMVVNFEEAAKFLDLSKSSFYRLIETGVIPKAGEGEYILGEVVESYWRNQKKLPPARIDEALARKRTDANIRLTLAKAKLREAQAAVHQQELTEKSMEGWFDKIINAKTHLRAIPTKVGPMLVGQDVQVIVSKLEDAIDEALQELADEDETTHDAWLPRPTLTVSEWADEFRRIPPEASAEPGIWRTSRAEYQREVMNAVSNPLTERVVMMTAAQVGKSEILLNVVGYFIDQEPSPILLIQPTIEMGESFSKDRVAPMVRDTLCLREKIHDSKTRFSGNTIKEKKFPGGKITIAGANSPASLASRPIRVLLCDEVDRYPVSAGTEGDPLSLAMKRTQNFWNRCIVWVSTPTLLGVSRIEKAYNSSSREEWCVPCPTCGEYQPYSWEQITFKDLPEPIMTCAKCGAKHNEVEWKSGQERGKWIAGNPDEIRVRGFHVNAFASAWVSWKSLIDQYTEAFRNGEEELKVWWNTVLGLPYENTSGTLEVEAMESHREEYKAELPDGVLVLTCGVDTQDDRLEAEVVGWGIGHESWGIEYRVFYGDPGQKEVWQALDDFLSKTWTYANGDKLGLGCVCIDSAGHFTDEVYRFCKPRGRRNIFAIVGRGREGMPSVSKPSRNNRRHVVLFTLGVTTIKGTLFSRLKVERQGAGYCHFPLDAKHNHRGYDAVYFKGLLSERMVVKRVKGKDTITWETRSPGLRNEPLDTRVYATGALELLNPNFEMHRQRRAKRTNTLPMLKLKQPVYIEKPEDKKLEPVPEEKKPAVKRSVPSGFFKRGLRM